MAKNLFSSEPDSRALATLIHDHNSAIGNVRNYMIFGLKQIKEGNLEKGLEYLEKAKEFTKQALGAVDVFYTKWKNEFQ